VRDCGEGGDGGGAGGVDGGLHVDCEGFLLSYCGVENVVFTGTVAGCVTVGFGCVSFAGTGRGIDGTDMADDGDGQVNGSALLG
jgi:hypothetical protein